MAGRDGAGRARGAASDRESVLALPDPLVCAFAPAAGGKTAFLVQKAARLIGEGADAPRVLVAVNTAEQARAFGKRLAEAGADPTGARIDVPHRILVDECAARGPAPRLLTRAELNIVIEDLKYEGAAPADIKAMLQAMRRALARGERVEGAAMGGGALVAWRALRERLRDMGATLREELPARVLEAQAAPAARPYDYVLVDDAQNLSVATLRALASLAGRQTVAAGNPLQALPGFDPGFASDALAFFSDACGARCVRLEPVRPAAPAIASFAQALCGAGFEDSAFWQEPGEVDPALRASVMHVKWREPKDEAAGICRIVANLLDADPDLLPRDVCIAVPDRASAAALEGELERRRLAFQTLLDDDPVAGDPRSRERQGTLGAYGLLGLAADLDDACAWRFWLALGRDDLGCGLWRAFRSYCGDRGLGCRAAALELGGCGEEAASADLGEVRGRVAEALSALRLVEGRRGFTLKNHLCRVYRSPQVARVLEFFDGVEEAPDLFRALQGFSFAPSFADRPSQVRIGSYRAVSTLSPRHVFAPGLVEGVVGEGGQRVQSPSVDVQRRGLGCAAAGARESFTASSFQRADLGPARHDRLPVRRTRWYQGREVAVFSPSPFLEDAGDFMPGSVSGEQYFIDERERSR